jgi:hypothetical protein
MFSLTFFSRKRAVEETRKIEDKKHKEEVEERQRHAFIDKSLVTTKVKRSEDKYGHKNVIS